MVAVPLLGIKLTSTLWLLPLTLAVTLVTPDLVLVKVKVTEPSAPVVPLVAITPLLSALKFTNRLGIRFPSASVTIAFTELVATPLANAPLVSILSAPLTMVAVPLLGIKFTSTLWLLPLTLAVTLVTPDLVLVKVKVTEPSAPVVPLAAITPLLSALKFTNRFGIRFPSASVTIAFTELVATPLAKCAVGLDTQCPTDNGRRAAVRNKGHIHTLAIAIDGGSNVANPGNGAGQRQSH
ncbi:Uncharacterised protein [Yersinia frederiksenii]|nr:Uncharacterised protein [Yersinia frederiksenii]